MHLIIYNFTLLGLPLLLPCWANFTQIQVSRPHPDKRREFYSLNPTRPQYDKRHHRCTDCGLSDAQFSHPDECIRFKQVVSVVVAMHF